MTTINLSAGVGGEEVKVKDAAGNYLPSGGGQTSFASVADPNVIVKPASDGIGFRFAAGAAAPNETLTTSATFAGHNGPIVGPELIIVVAAAAPEGPLSYEDAGPVP